MELGLLPGLAEAYWLVSIQDRALVNPLVTQKSESLPNTLMEISNVFNFCYQVAE